MLSRRRMLLGSALGATGFFSSAQAQEIIAEPSRVGPPVVWEGKGGPIEGIGDTKISVADSPLPNALDMYYSFLVGLAKANGLSDQQKLLLNNTITAFDISQDTPYYNESLFRNFADRVFLASPQSIGPANKADRFSKQYEEIIRIAASKIDRKYNQITSQIDDLQRKLQVETERLSDRIVKINDQWTKIVNATGLKSDDPTYELKYINFLESVRYADQIASYTANIDMIVGSIDAVRRSKFSPAEQKLLDVLNELSDTKKLVRPKRPTFERTVKDVTDLTFANPTLRNNATMDTSPPIYPVGDLVKFLKLPGPKSFSVNKGSVAAEQHDRSWSAGGSIGYGMFSIGGSASGSSSFRQDISKSAGISVGFENLSEYLVDREMWFDPSLFSDAELATTLSKIPGIGRLQYVSVSLIIARGLTLQLTFNDSITTSSWSKRSFAASGGISVFGFSFGASGGNSSYDYNLDVSTDGKTVTFKDDPQLSRVLAVRLEPLATVPQERLAAESNPNIASDMEAAAPGSSSPLGKFRKGEISYKELQQTKFK